MDIQREIARKVEQLPPSMQEEVLRFVTSLNATSALGEKGSDLRQFSNSIDALSAQQMRDAIERECEQIDSSQW